MRCRDHDDRRHTSEVPDLGGEGCAPWGGVPLESYEEAGKRKHKFDRIRYHQQFSSKWGWLGQFLQDLIAPSRAFQTVQLASSHFDGLKRVCGCGVRVRRMSPKRTKTTKSLPGFDNVINGLQSPPPPPTSCGATAYGLQLSR